MRTILGLLFLLLAFSTSAQINSRQAQRIDSTSNRNWVMTNVPKSKFWGNSWQVATSYTLSWSNEFDFNIGRSYGKEYKGESLNIFTVKSWGLGYGILTGNGETKQIIKAYTERSFFSLPPLNAGVRAEYIYNVTDSKHYFRPSIGASFLYFDLLYSYSLLLNTAGNDNDFKSGLTFRFKYYIEKKTWQINTPKR